MGCEQAVGSRGLRPARAIAPAGKEPQDPSAVLLADGRVPVGGSRAQRAGPRPATGDPASPPAHREPLGFKPSQAASTVFLATAICFFPEGVDPAFLLAAYANLVVSAIHHGLMVQTRPHHRSRLFGRDYLHSCTDCDESQPLLRMLRAVDQSIVGFVCLYTGTGCAGLIIPQRWVCVRARERERERASEQERAR
jgi:hypothetical protein